MRRIFGYFGIRAPSITRNCRTSNLNALINAVKYGYTIVDQPGPDALGAFRANPAGFDLVLSDIGMPNMTGEQLARELISIKPDIPIIICTGFSDEDDENRARDIDVKAFLKKPVSRGDLAEMVRNELDKSNGPTFD